MVAMIWATRSLLAIARSVNLDSRPRFCQDPKAIAFFHAQPIGVWSMARSRNRNPSNFALTLADAKVLLRNFQARYG